MSRKNREKRQRQAANPPAPKKKETVFTILLDLIKDPVDKEKTKGLGKFLGFVCLGMAICLLFYISGGNI